MAELWVSTGAIWRDMLLAEALVCIFFQICDTFELLLGQHMYLRCGGKYYRMQVLWEL